jgi:hypothetical protein
MDIVGWYFGAAVTLIPTWLVLRAWHSYSKLDKRSLRDLPQMRTGIACSRLGRKSAGESLPLRKAIGLASGCLMLIWLLVLSNPH